MAVPKPSELPDLESLRVLEEAYDEFTLTCSAFVKFQMRRQGDSTAGRVPFKTNIVKILKNSKDSVSCQLDMILKATVEYVQHIVTTSELYELQPVQVKVRIL